MHLSRRGAWVSGLALAEASSVISGVYERNAADVAHAVAMLLNHKELVLEDSDTVAAALDLFCERPALGFSDCLIMELARKARASPARYIRPEGGTRARCAKYLSGSGPPRRAKWCLYGSMWAARKAPNVIQGTEECGGGVWRIGALLARRRCQDGHHDEALRTGIADRVQDAGRGEGGISGREALLLVSDRDQTLALDDDVQFVLAFMSMRGVLLAGLKRIQAGKEELALYDGGLAHASGIEAGPAGDVSEEHDFLV
jgi:hypothetical protein